MINKLVFSNLGHRPVRTALSVLAIAVEVTMILTLVGVSYGTLDSTSERARGVGADIMIRPPGSSIIGLSTAPIPDSLVPLVAKQPHVAQAIGTAVLPLSGFDSMTGIDIEQFTKMSGGFHFLAGGPFQSDQDVIVDEYYAKEKHLHVGDKLNCRESRVARRRHLRIGKARPHLRAPPRPAGDDGKPAPPESDFRQGR